ncbi:MAG: hypothetical protein HY926_12715 [Elusimicrobia bacterium]|nr:hypothetical protein [Elusimicrobiota bacterium]
MRILPLAAALCLVSPVARAQAQHLDISVTDAPLGQFLDTVSKQTKVSFVLGQGTEDQRVTLAFKGAPVRQVLDQIKQSKGLGYQELAPDIYLIAAEPVLASCPGVLAGYPALDAKITIDVRQAPLSSVFARIGGVTGLRFALVPQIRDWKATLSLQKVPARQAVQILCVVKGLSVRAEGQDGLIVEAAIPEAPKAAASRPDGQGLFTGYRGVSLSLPGHQLAFLKKGDHVDVMVTFDAKMADERKEKVTATILQNVRIVDVSKPGKGEERGTVQILLNPNEAQYAALSDAQGDLHVALRAPGDTEMHPMEMASFRKLFR